MDFLGRCEFLVEPKKILSYKHSFNQVSVFMICKDMRRFIHVKPKRSFVVKNLWLFVMAGLLLGVWEPGVVSGETPAGNVIRNDISKTINVDKKIQSMKTEWSQESKDLTDRLDHLTREAENLEQTLEGLILRQGIEEQKYNENLRREKEADRVRTELTAYLNQVLSDLESAVDEDLPFLKDERSGRLASLKELLVDPQQSPAEKFRRVFEALQIEAEYGTTVEVTQQNIELGGTEILTDVLRLGRLSLFCQTIDGTKSGVFDQVDNTWKPLPEKVNRNIARAIAMARLERSIELVELPLGRIVVP